MRRKIIMGLAALAAAIAPAIATTAPAAAAGGNSGQLKERFGSYSLGMTFPLTDGNRVFQASSTNIRPLSFVPDGLTFNGAKTGTLKFGDFDADNDRICAGAPDSHSVIGTECSGVTGIRWAEVPLGFGHFFYVNVHASSSTDELLTGDNIQGHQFTLDCRSCHSGDEQQFEWVS